MHLCFSIHRSSRTEVFCKKGVLRNFTKFTGKHLCQRLFFNKVAGLRAATLLKKSLWHRCFPVNFAKFLRTPFFTEHLRWLLLNSKNIHFIRWKNFSVLKLLFCGGKSISKYRKTVFIGGHRCLKK